MDVQQRKATADKAALEGRLTESLSEAQALRNKQDQIDRALQTEVEVHPELKTICLTWLSEAPALLRLWTCYAGWLLLKDAHKLKMCICRRSAA